MESIDQLDFSQELRNDYQFEFYISYDPNELINYYCIIIIIITRGFIIATSGSIIVVGLIFIVVAVVVIVSCR